jgi:hypothetical protein
MLSHIRWFLNFFTSDRIIAIATATYAVVTWITYRAIKSQAEDTQLQAKIAEDAARAAQRSANALTNSERAWLIGKPNMQKFEGPPEPGQVLLYVCNIKNIGRTPARILESGLALRKAKSLDDIPQIPDYRNEEVRSFNEIVIIPRDSFASTTVGQVWKGDYLAIKPSAKGLILYACGFVKYLDIFNDRHETHFCHYYYIPGPLEPQIEGWRVCELAPAAYNRAI